MTEHTHGPWHMGTGGLHVYDESGAHIATCAVPTGARPFEEYEANARFIAAAPELLAIVERVAAFFDGTDAPLGNDARAAIAKARGEAVKS